MPSNAIVAAGTDTEIGKSVFSAMLTLALDGIYWKPVQSGVEAYGGYPRGIDGRTDSERVRQMAGLPPERFLRERYVLTRPLSPHRAAELDGVEIDTATLATLPKTDRTLIVELAGGLMVPLTRLTLQIDVLARWGAPVALCARTQLGTINHTLLSVEALRRRKIPLLGIVFIGDSNEDSERTICGMSKTPRLGRLPWLKELNAASLMQAFTQNFSQTDFLPELTSAPR